MPKLAFPRWVPEAGRQVLQAEHDSSSPGPWRALIERLAADPRMHTAWSKLPPNHKDPTGKFVWWGEFIWWAVFYASDEVLNALLEPDRIRTPEDAAYRGTKTPTLLALRLAADSAKTLRDNAREIHHRAASSWAEGWKGNPDVTPDKLLKILDDTAAFYKWLCEPLEAVMRATPQIKKRRAKNARQLAYALAISSMVQSYFGRPCDEAVAALVEVVFDLPEAATVDVRNLRRERATG